MRDKIDSISINLPCSSSRTADFVRESMNAWNRSGLNWDQLKIEVTERVLLQDMDYMKMMMEEMTGEGFGFYLDDFGTGYSNISCALSLPFEYIAGQKPFGTSARGQQGPGICEEYGGDIPCNGPEKLWQKAWKKRNR